jgi:basic membrane lipoprotein Med (substrate-binding protein (PBP1-ABC) superfamily)
MINRRVFLAAPVAAALAGCGGNEPSGEASAPPAPGPGAAPAAGSATTVPTGSSFKVGLLTAGALTDSGWNSLAGQGLAQMKRDLGAVPSHQTAQKSEAEEALRGFARDGVKLVFAHGSEFGDAAKRVAAEHEDTIFVVSSGEVEGKNLASLKFDLGEASYLAGMVAASLSKSGKAGQIGGEEFPPVRQAFELFEKGGKVVNPAFSAPITYLGSWTDANAGKEKALSMIRSGADVIFQNADAAGEGVFQAAEESADKGVLVIGSNANQNTVKPNLIPASAVLDVAKTFMSVAKEVVENKFKGGTYLQNLKSGNVYLAINPEFEGRVPVEVREKIKKAEEEIKNGKLKLT